MDTKSNTSRLGIRVGIFWFAAILLCINVLGSFRVNAETEADYVKAGCTGIIEYVLPDKTRVDCLTTTHAIEYDWGHKWAEAVGQSLHYAAYTGRRAGIVLITPNARHEARLRMLIAHYNLPIDLWIVEG